jgi:sialate O-acetylesterase
MEMPLMGWPPADTINYSAREITAADYPMIRIFNVARNIATQPLDTCGGNWSVCSPETAADYSATAYFFGKELYRKLGVPVGLITSSWGGTPAQAWTSKEFVKNFPAYAGIVDSFPIAMEQHDSLLRWMDRLPNTPVDPNNRFSYTHMDYKEQVYAATDYNDSGWGQITVPALWESTQLPDFDGVVWFRKKFNLPAGLAGKEMMLHLGPIDDMDMAFINGQKIGANMETGNWKTDRLYTVPAGLLHSGENLLAVCVVDITGGGGLYGEDDITLSSKKGEPILLLRGKWKYLPIAEIMGNKIFFYDSENNFFTRPKSRFSIGPSSPTTLYNAMIYPLIPYTIKGAIWYQGEANVGRGYEYRELFPEMIASWRAAWQEGDFPFYYVQIAPWEYGDKIKSPAAEVREAQLMALRVPNTGMAVTMDIGNPVNIHPANKQDVGKRLALWALAKEYGYDSIVYSGPLFKSISIDGNKIIVSFDHTHGGLIARGGELTHFELAGEDQVYLPAKATIVDETVIVSAAGVPNPVAVRYGWSATAEPNLFNGAGLPASPFRSDNWKRLSE